MGSSEITVVAASPVLCSAQVPSQVATTGNVSDRQG